MSHWFSTHQYAKFVPSIPEFNYPSHSSSADVSGLSDMFARILSRYLSFSLSRIFPFLDLMWIDSCSFPFDKTAKKTTLSVLTKRARLVVCEFGNS